MASWLGALGDVLKVQTTAKPEFGWVTPPVSRLRNVSMRCQHKPVSSVANASIPAFPCKTLKSHSIRSAGTHSSRFTRQTFARCSHKHNGPHPPTRHPRSLTVTCAGIHLTDSLVSKRIKYVGSISSPYVSGTMFDFVIFFQASPSPVHRQRHYNYARSFHIGGISTQSISSKDGLQPFRRGAMWQAEFAYRRIRPFLTRNIFDKYLGCLGPKKLSKIFLENIIWEIWEATYGSEIFFSLFDGGM